MELFGIEKIKHCAKLLKRAFGLTPQSLGDIDKIDEISSCVIAGFERGTSVKFDGDSFGRWLDWDPNTAVFWHALAAYNVANSYDESNPDDGFEAMAGLLSECGENIIDSTTFMDVNYGKHNKDQTSLFADHVHYIWALAFFGDEDGSNREIENRYKRDRGFAAYLQRRVKGLAGSPMCDVDAVARRIADVDRKLAECAQSVARLREQYGGFSRDDVESEVPSGVAGTMLERQMLSSVANVLPERGDDRSYGIALCEGKAFEHDVDKLFDSYIEESKQIVDALFKIKRPYSSALICRRSFAEFAAQCEATERDFHSDDTDAAAYARRMGELQTVKTNIDRARSGPGLSELIFGDNRVFRTDGCVQTPELIEEINASHTLADALGAVSRVNPGRMDCFIRAGFELTTETSSHPARAVSSEQCDEYVFEKDRDIRLDSGLSTFFLSTLKITNRGSKPLDISVYFAPYKNNKAIIAALKTDGAGTLYNGRLSGIESKAAAKFLKTLQPGSSCSLKIDLRLAPQFDCGIDAAEYNSVSGYGFLPRAIISCATNANDFLAVPGEYWKDVVDCAECIAEVVGRIAEVENKVYHTQLLGVERGLINVGKKADAEYAGYVAELKEICDIIGPISYEKLTKQRCDALGIEYCEADDKTLKSKLEYVEDINATIDKINVFITHIFNSKREVAEYSAHYKFNTLDGLDEAFAGMNDLAGRNEVAALKNRIRAFSGSYDASKHEALMQDAETLIEYLQKILITTDKTRVVEKSENERNLIAFDKNGDQFNIQCRLMEADRAEIDTDVRDDSDRSFDVYDYAYYHDLMDAAINVRKQSVFGNFGDYTTYAYFKPFKYQLDSVRTMLSRFEGRGIYGDQVGLGKTLQMLMTAYVMFKCRTIRNALIIVPPGLTQQWRKECQTKFRDDDGECLFDIYPEDERKPLTFEDIKKLFDKNNFEVKGKKGKKGKKSENVDEVAGDADKLKIYLVSDGVISAASEQIAAATYADNMLYECNKVYTELPADIDVCMPDFSKFVQMVNKTGNRSLLALMEKKLKEEYEADVKSPQFARRNGSIDIDELNLYAPPGELLDRIPGVNLPDLYNDRLKIIFKRLDEVAGEREQYEKDDLYKKLSVDLLMYDEVDRLISGNMRKAEDADGNELDITTVQEFLSRLDKKFCVLASATPIRTDLSDIFNLLYIVDRTKLGDTREIAENRFYNIYCGGYRSLSEMATDKNVESKLQILNGLINSMFTRKRVTDADVRESMRRKCSTADEIAEAVRLTAAAKAAGVTDYERDDYGGQKFVRLAELLSDVYKEVIVDLGGGLCDGEETLAEWKTHTDYAFMHDPRVDELFADAELLVGSEREKSEYEKAEIIKSRRIECLIDMAKGISDAYRVGLKKESAMSEQDGTEMLDVLKSQNPCRTFCKRYAKLREEERLGNYDAEKLKSCNLWCSFINRGLLDFSRAKHDYSTVFIADYLDWRRPVKRDKLIPIHTRAEKIAVIGDLLVRDDSGNPVARELGLTDTDIQAVLSSKTLVFEKESKRRAEIYRELCKIALDERGKADHERDEERARQTAGRREVYINLDDKQVQENNYTAAELLDLGYFYRKNPDGKNSGFKLYEKIKNKQKNGKPLSLDEKRFIEVYNKDGQVISEVVPPDGRLRVLNEKIFEQLNYKWFTRFMMDNGNWNAVYFIDSGQRAGTDLNAANILIIANLDYYTQEGTLLYLDPLDMEQLVGRISRTGQTEECVVYSMLYSGLSDCSASAEFNAVYYDILKDTEGFDLFSACKTEVDFVVPVVMACARQLFSKDGSYLESETVRGGSRYDEFSADHSPFIAVYKDNTRRLDSVRESKEKFTEKYKRFPDILRFAFDQSKNISVVRNYTDEAGVRKRETVSTTDAIKYMIRLYARLLGHERKSEE